MKNTHTFNVHFLLKKGAVRKDGSVPVNARISVDGKRLEVSAQVSVLEIHWNPEAGRVNPRSRNARTINDHLDTVYADIVRAKKQLVQEGQFLTPHAVKLRYLGKDKRVGTLKELIAYHRENDLQRLAPGTAKNYNATETYLERFLKKRYKSSDVPLAQIDYACIMAFDQYLRICPPIRKCQPLTNNGIMKHLERFKKLMTLADKFGWIRANPFALHTPSFEEYDSAFLEQSELDVFANYPLKDMGRKRVRDVFVFSCYTGLSYIEVKNLKQGDIVIGFDGEDWISVRRQKTKTPVKVPLLEQAKTILERYADHPKEMNGFALLPVYSDQKINKYLKGIATQCGINKHLTFHVARHTFATTITLLNDVPLETVSKMLGHIKLSTTQRYARVLEMKISNDVALLKQRLLRKQHRKACVKNEQPNKSLEKACHLRLV